MNDHEHTRINAEELRLVLEHGLPFNRFLGLRVARLGDGEAALEVPYRPELVGNPIRPALHGGVISALLDTSGGAAVWTQIGRDDVVATVDLRVDYLRPARPELLIGTGRVVRLGNRVGVVQLRAHHLGDEDRPVAAGTGVYNITRTAPADDFWNHLLARAAQPVDEENRM